MNVAFDVVFAVFVASIIVLAVVAIRWGARRDRVARAQRADPSPAPRPLTGTPVTPASEPEGPTP